MMKDSTLSADLLREAMALNPPRLLENGHIFTGPVRLCFPFLLRPQEAKQGPDSSGRESYSADLLFPLGADLTVFGKEWARVARSKFPQSWDAQGNPVGLHYPIHDQREKAFGPKPKAGYTPGALHFTASSLYAPRVVDLQMNDVTDEKRIYPGVWAYVAVNVYSYSNRKTGVGFGLQTVMLLADDQRLAGGGGNPQADFAGVKITNLTNVASMFNGALGPVIPQSTAIMPAGGYMGVPGTLPIQPLTPASGGMSQEDIDALM